MEEGKANLCHYCLELFPIEDNGHSTRPFHSDVATMLLEAGKCHFCAVIQNRMNLDGISQAHASKDSPMHNSASLRVRLKEPHQSEGGVRWGILEISIRMPDAQGEIVKDHTFSITTCERSSPKSHHPAWKSLASSAEDKISLINTWLQHCDSSHGHGCMPTIGRMPKRLIQVGSAKCPPRLVLGENISFKDGKYATLSHCWGGALPIQLLKANLQMYCCEIPFNLIPRTFRDAIAITRASKISYLWIDALCIIQDSREDWEVEAVNMKDIYSGSSLNIAASDASRSQEGCFPDLQPENGNDVSLFNVDDADRSLKLAVRVQTGDPRHATKSTILSSRGWVLQEQLLSHRMVSCMRSEIHWECMRTYETEAGAQFEQTVSNVRGVPRLHLSSSDISKDRLWRSWMTNYSKRNFTIWNDRLPALSGIIQHYRNITEDIPLFGLWKTSLLQDLLWVRLGPVSAEPSRILRATNLPSWSWLSCPTEVDFDIWQMTRRTNQEEDPFVTVEDHCNLIDHFAEWSGPPYTSKIKEARLVLEGPTLEVYVRVAQDTQLNGSLPLVISVGRTEAGQFMTSSRVNGQFDDENSTLSRSYTGFLLRSREHRETKRRREIFLILEQIADHAQNPMYKRVGIACFMGDEFEFRRGSRKQLTIL